MHFKKIADILTVTLFLVTVFGISGLFLLRDPQDISKAERRRLAQYPEFRAESVLSGRFFEKLETASADQFPAREIFRRMKAFTRASILGRKENHGIYLENGSAIKRESTFSRAILEKNLGGWRTLREIFPKSNVYYCLFPDKHFFGSAPVYSYGEVLHIARSSLPSVFCEISLGEGEEGGLSESLLELGDFYRTDLHWRQEHIHKVAKRIADTLGVSIDPEESYTCRSLGDYYGAYFGQSAFSLPPDSLVLCESPVLSDAEVYLYEEKKGEMRKKTSAVYDLSQLETVDAYSVYLSGAQAVVEIENRHRKDGGTLVLFRDSFGSSLAPYLISGYHKIYLIDLRYISKGALRNIEFTEVDDVLFLYSSSSISHILMN